MLRAMRAEWSVGSASAVHGHRHGHLVERDAVEELAHVEDGIDRDARHADVAGDARVVAVIAAMGGEVEGDRQALLAGREVAPVERVRLLGSGEAGILADRPGLLDIHGRVGAAQEGRGAGNRIEEAQSLEIGMAVGTPDRDALGRRPLACRLAVAGLRRGPSNPGEIRNHAQLPIPVSRREASSISQKTAPSVGPSRFSAASTVMGRSEPSG